MTQVSALQKLPDSNRDLKNADILKYAVNNITNDNFAEPVNVANGGTGNTVGASYQSRIDIIPFFPTAVSGVWIVGTTANMVFNAWTYNTSNTQNDSISFEIYLMSGTYTLKMLNSTEANRGIFTVSIDGSSVGTVDGYSAATAYNVVGTITGISVATSGLKTLMLKAATRNASATGWLLVISLITLIKTA